MKKKGFTLVELVIVIVIVGILSIVAVPIYRAYVRRSMATEGKALLSSILTAEKAYFAEYGHYKEFDQVDFDEELNIDGRSNKYFQRFFVSESVNPGEFYARTDSVLTKQSGDPIFIILYFGKTMLLHGMKIF